MRRIILFSILLASQVVTGCNNKVASKSEAKVDSIPLKGPYLLTVSDTGFDVVVKVFCPQCPADNYPIFYDIEYRMQGNAAYQTFDKATNNTDWNLDFEMAPSYDVILYDSKSEAMEQAMCLTPERILKHNLIEQKKWAEYNKDNSRLWLRDHIRDSIQAIPEAKRTDKLSREIYHFGKKGCYQ